MPAHPPLFRHCQLMRLPDNPPCRVNTAGGDPRRVFKILERSVKTLVCGTQCQDTSCGPECQKHLYADSVSDAYAMAKHRNIREAPGVT